jgi:hypothetical protein
MGKTTKGSVTLRPSTFGINTFIDRAEAAKILKTARAAKNKPLFNETWSSRLYRMHVGCALDWATLIVEKQSPPST